MPSLNAAVLVLALVLILILIQVYGVGRRLREVVSLLHSIDEEVFHIAQEQKPEYGLCSKCGRRAIVSQVVLRNQIDASQQADIFYCQRCWWLSGDAQLVMDDKKTCYKDRQTELDIAAAIVGPGRP